MRIGNLTNLKEKFGIMSKKVFDLKKSSNFVNRFLDFSKLLIVYVIVFQMFTQPVAVLAQSRAVLEVSRPQSVEKSNIKPKVEEVSLENFLPDFENKARKTFSDAFGVNVPLPQVFGENGKLNALFGGGNAAIDKNKELIDSALNNGRETNTKAGKNGTEKVSNETAISLNAPILNSGTIEGSLRTLKEIPFNINNNFRVTENLYAAGSPSISTAQDSQIQNVVNEESDDLADDYRILLNGGQIDGNIYIHSSAENIFKDIPLGLPKPAGSENVEIKAASDLQNIKDWNSVKSLTINTENLTIPIPAGNYEKITLNAPNKLVFTGGNYNFSDTINFQKGSSIQIKGKTNIGIGNNLLLEQTLIKASENVSAEDVKINIFGSSVVLDGKSELDGLIRATGANVIINEQSKITGQIIAGSLVMNGGIVTKFSPNGRAIFAPAVENNLAVVKEGFTLSGRIEGSVQQLSGQNTIINGNASITGDLLVPGVPGLVRNGNNTFGGVITGTGAATPTNYQITLNGNTSLRNLKNRINPVTMPTVAAPPASQGTVSVVINNSSQYPTNFFNVRDITMNGNAGIMTLPPGNYRNISISGGSGVKLGVAGQTTPVTYNLSSFVINGNSQIQVVSPVILNLATGLNLNASVGVSSNPEWLKVNVATGNVTLNGNSSLYGGVIAPDSIVTINGNTLLVGNVVCKKLTINGNGILRNVLPNLLSDTNISITSPANNSTTANSSITVSGTAQSSVGVANVFVNNQSATVNSSANTWTIPNVALAVGNNTITARAVDSLGTEVSAQINVTRQQPVVDVAPPVIAISSPVNNSTTQSQTITVSGTAADPGTNASGLASVTVGGQNATLNANGNWTISGVAINLGSNTITARATDNAGNYAVATVTINRQSPDTTAPTLSIVSPANNAETTNSTTTVSGTVTDTGTNPSGVASVTVNGQTATINGSSWTIANIALTLGTNTIIANAIDNAGNSSNQQITVRRIEADTTAPTIVINTPVNNSETNNATVSVSGTASDPGANASGVASVAVNGQNANFSNGNWSISSVSLNIGANTLTVRAVDVAGNAATSVLTVIRREPDNQPPVVTITSPVNNFQTTDETATISGTVVDSGANASGVQSVVVNGITATINGGTWTAANVSLNIGTNTITPVARDNNNNSGSASISITRNPLDTTPPTITITSPGNNFETFDSQIVISGTAVDTGAGATGVQSVLVNGNPATFNVGTGAWTATVNLTDGANTINAVAVDNAPTLNYGQASVQVRKIAIQPPTLTTSNPLNGAFLSTNSVTVAGTVSSNKPDMTFAVTINGATANLAGREFTRTVNLSDGANVITAIVTDALGQQAQQSITVTNDRTPPTVFLTNVPQIVSPGESYTIGATAADAYGIADVEFTVDGASITRSSVSPYQFVLNIPLTQSPNQNLNISAIARDNAGLSATATARVVTSGPSGLTGYVFDDATGYVLPNSSAKLNNQTPVLTNENGLYSFISSNANGIISITKQGYTSIERSYSAAAGSGVEVFDARLSPLDSRINTADVNGSLNASDSGNKVQIGFAPNSFPAGADVRVTPISPQGLANLLPFGWSPVPGALVDVRTANETEFSNRNFTNPASLTIARVADLPSDLPIVLARYNSTTHNWVVLQKDLFAGANGMLQATISASGQYAFLVADTGATAPPNALPGQNLPASAAANSEQLDTATASASSSPGTALYSNTAKARINFTANSVAKLPSGISIEASFNDTYIPIIDRNAIAVERPSQDFVLYAFPSVSVTEPNKLGAYFVAKPVRTDFGLTDLLNAKVRVEIRSGRLAQSGVLIGTSGGVIRSSEGSELEIPGGSVNNPQVVFFNKLSENQTGIILPPGYENVGAFEVNLAGNMLTQSAKISMPALSGDNSKIVVAKVISIAGQQGLKVVGRVVENNSRLETTVSQPTVPSGVNLGGIKDGGKYIFVRMPGNFGYVKGTVSSAIQNTQAVKITNTNTLFVDLTGNNGTYTVLGLANGESIQVDGVSLNNDATGFGTTSLTTQNAVANLPISLASAALSVSAVTPTNAAANVIVTTPITVTFNKPISSATVTGSNVKLVTANGNPVITTISIVAGGRSVILTPSSNLQSETNYKVQVSNGIRDIYGNALGSAFESTFRTANVVTVSNRLQPSQIRIAYPNEQGNSVISIPAGAVPSGSTVLAINNSSGATVSMIAGSIAIEILIQARVGDEIELIIRQPDGTEYRIKQAAYRRADGFVSVGSNGGTITSEDGTLVLQVPPGAISGQADVKMSFAPESTIAIPRTGEMAPGEMNYIGGVKIEAQGNFTNTEELHLELPAPTGVQEGQRALVMKPVRINYSGAEIDTWETITSAKVEGGKIKTTSPPFYGVTLVAALGTLALLYFYVFVPARQRVITGLVRKQKTDGTYEPVTAGHCYVPRPRSVGQMPTDPPPPPIIKGDIQPDGKFALNHNNILISADEIIQVKCESNGVEASGIATMYNATEPGVSGFEVRYANIIYPANSTVNQPPQISMQGLTMNPDGTPVPEESDTLRQFGKVQVGANVRLFVTIAPRASHITTQQLIINGVTQNFTLQCESFPGAESQGCQSWISTPVAGRYSVVVKARTSLSNPATETVKTFNFIVLNNPNVRPPISDVNPAVVSITPSDGASQIDVGSSIHIEFSEPVKNLQSSGAVQTIYLIEDEESGARVGGRILSGGLPVSTEDARSVIDFIPNTRLKSGKNYKLVVTTQVIDTNGGNPSAIPPVPADADELRHLDQNISENGWQEFTSRFKTFQGSIITPTPINAQGYKIAVLDDYVITTKPFFNGIGSTGEMYLYNSTEFLGATDPVALQPINDIFVPHPPLGLAAKKQTLSVGGQIREINLVAVTTLSLDTNRPRNVWFYQIDENNAFRLIGVVSLVGNGNGGQVPNSISIERNRAYIGSSSNGGVYVVDIQQAIDEFAAQDDTPDDGNEYNNIPVKGAISLPGQPYAGGFGQSALMQRATYLGGNESFPVYNVSTITQSLIPFTYTTSFRPKLISFNFNPQNDGRLGFTPGGANGTDGRVTANLSPTPVSGFFDIEAVGGLQIQGATKDIAVGVAEHLFIFDVTVPGNPKQFPIAQTEETQQPARSFAELGVPLEVGSSGKQVELEETLAYVMFDNGIGVFDISNPGEPYLTTLIRGLSGLRYLAVKDGFIYTLGNNGLNVSIGRAVAQVVTYGYDPNLPEEVCGNPVVISKGERKMMQPAGIFFQLYGHNMPREASVVIRKVETSNGNRTETEIATVPVNPNNLRTLSNSETGTYIINGSTFWADTEIEIEETATYTAEVVIDNDFRSKQVNIPFSNLLPETIFQKTVNVREIPTSSNQTFPENRNVGSLTYLAAGNLVGVEFTINEQPYVLFDGYYREPSGNPPRPARIQKGDTRSFGSNSDYLLPENLPDGLYPFKYTARLRANRSYSEEVAGIVRIGNISSDVRKPGSTVVNGVEINSGSLAMSENDFAVKGRGLSLDFTRSYNSQSSDNFGTLGYGWSHSYQVSLTHFPGGYQMIGGEGGNQTFLQSKLENGEIKAEAPFLGKLVKNADGTFDYFTKSQTKYHFRQPVEQGSPNVYLGNLEYIEDTNRNRITLSYDTFGRVSSVTDSASRKLNFEYEVADDVFTGINVGDAIQGLQGCPRVSQFRQITRRLEQSVTGKAWRIKKITGIGVGGLTIDYSYNEKGNLISVNRSGTDSTISAATADRLWKYAYNPSSDGSAKYDHLLKTVKSPNNSDNNFTEYKYLLSVTAPPRLQQILMPEGVNNSFIYNADATTNVVNSATFTDGNGNSTNYELQDGRVKTITAPLGAVTRLEWTDFGQIKKTTDPEGKVTEIVFDDNNNPSTQTLTGGGGETIETVTTFDNKFSKMTSFKDGNGNTTRYAINQTTGNVDEITMPNGRTVLFHYYPNGDLKDVTDQYGTKTDFANYDSYGNPQTITKNLGGGQTQIIAQTFDARSRQRSKSDSLGTNSTMQYDAFDRPTEQITEDPAGYRNALTVETIYLPEGQPDTIIQKDGGTELSRTKNTYDKLQRLTQTVETVSGYGQPFTRNFTYDLNSNLKTEENRRGISTRKTYNALNHLTKIVQGTKTVWEATEIDKVGNPKTVRDLYGNTTTYIYDGLQRLREKQLPEGVTEKLEYDNNNNIVDSFDRNNKRTHYTYDSLNRAATITDALGRITQWTYTDAEHKVVKETAHRGLTETTVMDGLERPITQQVRFGSNNYQTSYVYDGRNVTVTDARGTVTTQKLSGFGQTGETEVVGATPTYKTTAYYTALGGVRQMTDALNRVTSVINDGFNRQRNVNYNGEFSESFVYDGEGLMTEHTDKRGFVSVMNYDELGRADTTVVRETVPTAKNITVQDYNYLDAENREEITDANAHKTIVQYDGLRRVRQMTNADGKVKSYTYDGENLRSETDFYNRPTAYEYDSLNRVTKIFDRENKLTAISYAANDLVKTTTDRRGNTFTEEYDALGRTLSSKDKLNNKIASFSYDANGNRLTQKDGNNNETAFVYDKLSRLTEIRHPNGLQTETFTYDAAGNVKTHNDGRGGTVESLEYNALDQLKRAKDGANNISEFQYDGGGLLLSKKDPKQNVTTYHYNAFGSMTEVSEPGQPAWTLSYDDAQNLTAVKDPRQNTVGYQYDVLNRLKKTTQPLDRITEYVYDNNSNVTKVTDPKGQTVEMTYTALDDVDTAIYKNSSNSAQLTLDYSYDAEQNPWRVDETKAGVIGTRTYTREFDERNRLTKNTDSTNKIVKFGYDAANNLKTLTDASNRITTYNYDGKNQLDTVVQNTNTIADYDWYSDGLLQKVSYQNNTNRNYVYDNADRVTNITNNLGGNQSESYDYGYDANSNRESEVRKENGAARRTASYQYDGLDRLKNVDYTFNVATPNPPLGQTAQYVENSEQNTYGYDAVGNRINETNRTQSKTITLITDTNGTSRSEQVSQTPEQTTTATFNELNELTQLNEPNGISTFSYDNNGNLSQISKNNSVISRYDYDVRNQLTIAKDGANNELARFDYDFERKRISKTSANITTNYTYAGSQIVNEYQSNSLTASYGIGAGEIVKSEFANGENNFHYTDALGSVTSLANATGSLTSRNEYNAFGELSTSGNTTNSIGYTGQRLDNETGLMALGNGERYYSPAYARFIQQDSVVGNSAMPQSLNRFAYANGNPFKYTDPSGNSSQTTGKNNSSDANSDPFAKPGLSQPTGKNDTGGWDILDRATNSDSYLSKALGYFGKGIYLLGDAVTFGGVSRQDRTITAFYRGEIGITEALLRTGGNVVVSAPLLLLGVFSGGTSIGVQIALTVAVTGIQKFAVESYEIGYEGRDDYSSVGSYAGEMAFAGALHGAFYLAGKYANKALQAVENKLTKLDHLASTDLATVTQSLTKAETALARADQVLARSRAKYGELGNWGGAGFGKYQGYLMKSEKSVKNIALGLSRHPKTGEDILENFAKNVGGHRYRDWAKVGLTDEINFVNKFYQATYRTIQDGGRIKFNLDFLNLDDALSKPRFFDPYNFNGRGGRFTDWELQQVIHNKLLYENTDFYIGLERLSSRDLVEFGIDFRGK
jgi:RHS repeat-associated protein